MIRTATPEDAPGIGAIWNAIIRDTSVTFTTVEKTSQAVQDLIRTQPFWVNENGGGVIGFATYGPFRPGPGYAHTIEHSIHVAATARGQGAGRMLMDRLATDARAKGVHAILAGISGENTGSIAFHARLGFIEAGRLPQVGRKFDRWHDLVLMQKFL